MLMNKENFDKKLRNWCQMKGGQARIAKEAKVSQAFISMYLAGKRNYMNISIMERIWKIIK